MPRIIVEFYGIPRRRAGRSELEVWAGTVGEALAAVERACPGLSGLIGPDGRLAPHYLLSADGRRFGLALSEPVRDGERLLLLSADAGG
ncbi:MAG: MoaD/ThiS family protein [Gemmataceae bacterium]|nr:MoaD/ThiS family protein [Gemmataceae bacterium]MDW8266029.1 MoaD/ThiS family protein [Gemmataceae bacterium]